MSPAEPPRRAVQTIWEITRRQFVLTLGLLTGRIAFGARLAKAASAVLEDRRARRPNSVSVALMINKKPYRLLLDPRTTLLDLLREELSLTGTKKGCDHGQCGACTVLANGRRINSCLALAAVHDGDEITTIEGLADGDTLHPAQAAFIECDGFQCGYCTPGQICSAVALIAEARAGAASVITRDLSRRGAVELTAEEIRERMSGNICRCGAYPGIVQAVQKLYQQTRG
jgi:xanthine dehydrogenase YagT iron-sulfur-binding subunit